MFFTLYSYRLRAVLTAGPGGPTLPGDPGKPVGPCKQKHLQMLLFHNKRRFEKSDRK